ncbi:MAG: PQQ-binding-like beta-propeller repeat protein [Deltaproteobacteria bacterium]|nr:PQQ-binding-like beta-propeller repeat protein [Deltaproteobacteria bacterium]
MRSQSDLPRSEQIQVLDLFLDRLKAPGKVAGEGTLFDYFVLLLLGLFGGAMVGALAFGDFWASEPEASISVVAEDNYIKGPAADAEAPALVAPELHQKQTVAGLLQFRGNPSRTYYGSGPLPVRPRILWRYPERPMCAESRVGSKVSTWCGTGWTGQPVIWERPDGKTEVIVGAYDRKVHFVDAKRGVDTRPSFVTGDIIKGSVTLDPDGDPLLYFGSRDNKLRILALDRKKPTELWAMRADFVPGIWNNDWDGNPVVIDDLLFDGGENGYFFALKLHRDYDAKGLVQVDPELLVAMRSWTPELLAAIGDSNVSIENSVAVYDGRAYFANSGGRVLGLDLRHVKQGRAPIVFDFWAGDDVDGSIVADEEGMLYVSVELERFLPRSDELGQLIKLNPYKPDDPVVWSLRVEPSFADFKGGIWSTPALGDGVLYVTTHSGLLMVVDSQSGQVTFTETLAPHAWSSPVLIGDELLVATCRGELRKYSVLDPRRPQLLWTITIPTEACIESTPAVWNGLIVVGARDGYLYAIGEDPMAGKPQPRRLRGRVKLAKVMGSDTGT